MPRLRSPVKLFGCTALLLILVRLLLPPADFAGATQAHLWVHFFDFRLDLTGYGLFEFAAFVLLLCALVYYLMERLTGRRPSGTVIQLHFWPSLLFAVFSVFLAHWVNHMSARVDEPAVQGSLNNWLTAFTLAFLGFIALQVVFAIGAVRSILLSRKAVVQQ
jgi:hypothetical protein